MGILGLINLHLVINMKKAFSVILTCAVFAVMIASVPVLAENPTDELVADHPMIGQTAPSFRLMDINGQELALEDLRGSYVVIHVAASW
jgi:hypothetical protein